ncbi:MAG: polyribonucleotide nucleotidyltransferase, partial [candidate division WOR-3 bacterium]
PNSEIEIADALYRISAQIMRNEILNNNIRVDGRKLNDIRPISCEVGILPRTHGSALFTRGETQALVIATLGTRRDAQILSELEEEEFKRFMVHYNFHPFSTNEVRPLRGPSRREIGHGALAEKALSYVIPDEDKFPYTIRLVSEITQSNGSTSMATVCGGTLALMDAGVPISSMVAGISIGLVLENYDKYALLTDIVGMEDHFGDMDFKIAGTRKGITAIQLDIKIKGLNVKIIKEAFSRAREAREYILDIMSKTISEPRKEVSKYAPKILVMNIPMEKIGDVIGPGGKVIRKIINTTNTKVEIDFDTGKTLISGLDYENVKKAKEMISEIIQEVEVGKVYLGKITRIENYGLFVEILPGKIGLVHISEVDEVPIKDLRNMFKVGDEVLVKVIEIDELGRPKLSRKQALNE